MYSVIIPLYNKEKYIVKAIQSVLDQTYSQFELIIVNDGSTDNSLNVVQPYLNQDKRIRLVNQLNSGVSNARNNGVKVSEFSFIAFLDADDWWHPDFLKNMKTLIEEYPEAGIYGSAYYTVKKGLLRKTNLGIEENFKGYIDYIQAYKHSWWMPLTSISVVIPKELFYRSEGFSSKLRFGEDFDLWIRIVLSNNVAFLNSPLAFYNQDVEMNERALGGKIWNPENHYIFNLRYLEKVEESNSELKKLLDGLRVRALLRYYLSGKFPEQTKTELNKVDFRKQPKYYRRIYEYPKSVVKLYFHIKSILSIVKQTILSFIN